MKRIISITFLLIAIVFSSKAQFENIDLSKYKLPEIQRHQLDVNFSNDHSFTKNNRKEDRSYTTFDLETNLEADYSFFQNTEKKQFEGWGNLQSDILLDWIKSPVNPFEKEDQYYFDLSGGFSKRNYSRADKWFTHLAPSFYANWHNYYERPIENSSDFKSKSFSNYLRLRPELKLGGGFGRIEPVGDIRRAIYMLEDLMKNDRLTKIPAKNEVYQLADKVAELRNQRFFDSRLRRIYEIKSLDSTLTDMNLVDESDATYFTSLNDMWGYGQENRYSGNRIEFNLIGDLNYSRNKSKTTNDDSMVTRKNSEENFYEAVGGIISYDSYKPKGLKRERYFGIDLSMEHIFDDAYHSPVYDYNIFNLNSKYRVRWFFNTRTYASFSIRETLAFNDYAKNEEEFLDYMQSTTSFNGYISYYFSPRLRGSFSTSIYYVMSDNEQSWFKSRFDLWTHIGVNYAIF